MFRLHTWTFKHMELENWMSSPHSRSNFLKCKNNSKKENVNIKTSHNILFSWFFHWVVVGITKKQNWYTWKIGKYKVINYLNVITWVNESLWLANKTDHFVLLTFFGGHCICGMFTSPNKILNHLEAMIFLMNFVMQPKWYSSIGRFGQNGYKPNMKYKNITII